VGLLENTVVTDYEVELPLVAPTRTTMAGYPKRIASSTDPLEALLLSTYREEVSIREVAKFQQELVIVDGRVRFDRITADKNPKNDRWEFVPKTGLLPQGTSREGRIFEPGGATVKILDASLGRVLCQVDGWKLSVFGSMSEDRIKVALGLQTAVLGIRDTLSWLKSTNELSDRNYAEGVVLPR